jgi:hypothetical protein
VEVADLRTVERSPLSLPDIVISGMPCRSSDGLPDRTLAVVASSCASRTRSGALSSKRFSEITRSPAGVRPCRSGSAISSLPTPVRSSASRLHVRRYVLGAAALRTGNAGSSPVPCAVPLHDAVDELEEENSNEITGAFDLGEPLHRRRH